MNRHSRAQGFGCLIGILSCLLPFGARGQEPERLFPPRATMPSLLAGARDPVTAASLLYVDSNPNQHRSGAEVEVALGTTLPVLLVGGRPDLRPVVLGLEAGVFARFGLQVLERELVATDWVFAIPVYWHRDWGWIRFRYYHSSSHMGDEYARRFEDPGINISRDAAELLSFWEPRRGVGIYAGARYAYNVHPEESRRWILRTGAHLDPRERLGPFRPYLAGDLEWDQDAGGTRLALTAGTWLPKVADRRSLRMGLVLLSGPSPLGQFNGLRTFHAGLTLRGSF